MKLSLPKKILMATIATLVFFVLLEGILAIAGVKPRLYSEDPYLGFSSHSPLFVRDQDGEGHEIYRVADNKLRLFNPQEFSAVKAPGTFRIFCLGGSTTFGRPFGDQTSFCGWLREMLPVADPSRHWEVINAGGVSYASYRVAVLMEELIQYQPDFFILYTGQNEFLEARSYQKIIAMPKALRGLGALAAKTRTWTLLEKVLKPEEKAGSEAKTILSDEVKTKLDASVGPSAYHRDLEEQKKTIEHFHFNLLRMIDMAKANNVGVELVVPGANLKDCVPFKSQHRPGLDESLIRKFDALMKAAYAAGAEGQLEKALDFLKQARSIDQHYAGQLYNEARVLGALGRWVEAKEDFEMARDEDVCPLRILSRMTDIVRKSADDRGVACVDFDAFSRQHSEHGIPGKNIFLDHVHPTIEGNFLLAHLILESFVQQGIVHPVSGWGPEALEKIKERVMASIDDEDRGLALTKLSKVLGWAGKMREAYDLSRRAIKLAPQSSSAWYQAGLTAQLMGKMKEAEAAYQRCLEIQPDADLPRQNLGVLLQKKGEFTEALEQFRESVRLARTQETVDANRVNLADTFLLQGSWFYRQQKYGDAVKSYSSCLEIQPQRAEAFANRGLANLALGSKREAIEDLEAAVRLSPKNAEIHNRLAIAYATAGQKEKAEKQWQEALTLDPKMKDRPDALPRIMGGRSGT